MNDQTARVAFSALSNATRLEMLRHLVEAGGEGLTAGEIADRAKATPSRASFHLTALSDAGLVNAERQARVIRYRASFAALGGLVSYLLNDCCKGDPTVRSCCGLPPPSGPSAGNQDNSDVQDSQLHPDEGRHESGI